MALHLLIQFGINMSAPARWIVDVQGFQVSMMNLVGHQTQQFGCFFIAAVGSLIGHGRQIEAPKMAQAPQTVMYFCTSPASPVSFRSQMHVL